MSKTRLAVMALLTGFITIFSSSAAHAYPDPTLVVTGGSAADGQVPSGANFTLFGTFGGTDCISSGFEFEGQSESDSGNSWSVSFVAPDADGTYTISITCVYEDGTQPKALGSANDDSATQALYTPETAQALPSVVQTAQFSFDVTVGEGDDDGDDDGDGDGDGSGDHNGVLPDTGGSAQILLLAAGALVIVGGGVVIVGRRRGNLT